MLARSDTFLGERYRRLSRRRGKLRAIVATGNSILTVVWHLLADPTAHYHDLGADYHDTRYHHALAPVRRRPVDQITIVIIPYRKPADGSELPDWKANLNKQHRRVRAQVEHALARMKTFKILRDYRRAAHTLTDTASGIAHLHNIILTG